MKKIFLTGAAGTIGKSLRKGLLDLNYQLRSSDRKNLAPINSTEETLQFELHDSAQLTQALQGIDAVIHLAAIPIEDSWENLLAQNIDATYRLFASAQQAGVKRIIFASTNHVTGFYRATQKTDVDVLPRPDTLYGVSKACGEALGRYFADKYDLSVACLRIGAFAERPTQLCHLPMWISPRDLTHLVQQCLEKTYHFLIVYGVSANTRNWWVNSAAKLIDYQPEDNSEAFANDLNLAPIDNSLVREFQGIDYCGIDFKGDTSKIE